MSSDDNAPKTCCLYRRKIVVNIAAVLTEEQCGIPESELADLIRFDLDSPSGHPVLAFRFCPWCGKPRDYDGEVRVVSTRTPPPE